MPSGEISIWQVLILLLILALFLAFIVSCVRSARRSPPERGGIAGWLRWYAVNTSLFFLWSMTAPAGWFAAVAFILPLAITVWIKKPVGRIVNLYGNYAYAALLGPLALILGVDPGYAVQLIGGGLVWGTYFLRSKRVRATYQEPDMKEYDLMLEDEKGRSYISKLRGTLVVRDGNWEIYLAEDERLLAHDLHKARIRELGSADVLEDML